MTFVTVDFLFIIIFCHFNLIYCMLCLIQSKLTLIWKGADSYILNVAQTMRVFLRKLSLTTSAKTSCYVRISTAASPIETTARSACKHAIEKRVSDARDVLTNEPTLTAITFIHYITKLMTNMNWGLMYRCISINSLDCELVGFS